MKRTLTLLSLILAAGMMLQAQIQYPVNGDFEDWSTSSFGSTTYDSLVMWDTPQRLAAALSVPDTVTYRTEMSNSGDAAVLLISKEVTIAGLLTVVVPGSISTGTFFVNLLTQEFGVNGGAPINCKPTQLTGFYQYMPAGADTANAVVIMFNDLEEEIANVRLELDMPTTGGYQPFTLPINYTGTGDPVIAQVLVTSSGVGGLDGSTMYADDLVLSGGDCITGINDLFVRPLSLELVPNPATEAVRFELPAGDNLTANIIDIRGRLVQQLNAVPGMNQVDITGLNAGLYFIQIAENGRTAYSGRFEKF